MPETVAEWSSGEGRIACRIWVAGWDTDVPRVNTCYSLVSTEQEAKDAAFAHVTLHLNKTKTESNENEPT